MRATLLVTLVLMLAATTVSASGDGPPPETYYAGPNTHTPLGSEALALCADSCPLGGGAEVPHIGGVVFHATGSTTGFVALALDEVWGQDVGMTGCIYSITDQVCKEPPAGCGPLLLTADGPFAESAVVFVYTLYVAEDLNVCGATTGQMYGTWF